MKKIIILTMSMALFFPFLAFADAEGYYSGSYARLSYVKGDVFVQRAGDLGYEQGEVNLVVIKGDKLGTKEGRAEIQFGRRNYLRLDKFTQVDFVNLPQSDYDPAKLHLVTGNVYLRINFLEKEKGFEVHTPDASFYILDEGLYRVDVRENKETELAVYAGSAEAAGEEGSLLVGDNERLTASNGKFSSQPTSFYARYDDFSEWNASRDALYARRITTNYLPSEIYEYEAELESYGRWVYESPYGYVWAPYVTYDNWQPYYYGRWVWYPIIGWTWVSYDPWGWCCFHYGRWGWRLGIGWYWIPTRYWGPSWVYWYWGYDYIGWCPLTYYNYPAVIINNIFYDHYTYNYFPTNSHTLAVVHRNQLQSPHISRVALGQNMIQKLGRITLRSQQPGIRPDIEREGPLGSKAASVFSRTDRRQVGQGYGSSRNFLNTSPGGTLRKDSFSSRTGTDSDRAIRSRSQETLSRFPSRINSQGQENVISNRTIERRRDSSPPSPNSESRQNIRMFPSRRDSSSFQSSRADDSPSSRIRSNLAPESQRENSQKPLSREFSERSGNKSSKRPSSREYLPRNNNPASSRRDSRQSYFRQSPRSSGESRTGSVSSWSSQRNRSNNVRDFFSRFESRPSRSYESQGRSSSRSNFPSFSRSASPSRSYSSPSRSFSSPSRSSSRSSSSFSRSNSSFSRSSPSRSFSSGSSSSRSSSSRITRRK